MGTYGVMEHLIVSMTTIPQVVIQEGMTVEIPVVMMVETLVAMMAETLVATTEEIREVTMEETLVAMTAETLVATTVAQTPVETLRLWTSITKSAKCSNKSG